MWHHKNNQDVVWLLHYDLFMKYPALVTHKALLPIAVTHEINSFSEVYKGT